MSDRNKIIGPALPPHLLSKFKPNERPEEEEDGSDSNESKGEASDAVGSSSNECDLYGPALPPHLIKPVVGAQLPSKSSLSTSAVTEEEEEDDDEAFGPLPEGINKDGEISLAHHQLEMRANYLKRKMAEEGSSVKEDKMMRESWMLELPPEKATSLGLGPRSFRMKAAPDMRNRSDWTDTPADRERKKMLGEKCDEKSAEEEMKLAVISERDKVMEEMVEKCKKKDDKRQLSLLEMHQKKLKKKQKKDKKKNKDKKPERRPFDRNIDLQANRFDEAQKKSIFKKAQLLDTRFSQGQSKFL